MCARAVRARGPSPRAPAPRSLAQALPQRSLERNRFGRLSVRCHYEAAEQRLVVEVLHAADLPPLDANGEGAGPGAVQGWGEGRWVAVLSPLAAVPPRPQRPICDRGAGPATRLPAGPQPEDPGQEPDPAPRVRRALLLVSVPPARARAPHRPAGQRGCRDCPSPAALCQRRRAAAAVPACCSPSWTTTGCPPTTSPGRQRLAWPASAA